MLPSETIVKMLQVVISEYIVHADNRECERHGVEASFYS